MAMIKHITMTCPETDCTSKAFVQVVTIDRTGEPNTPEIQKEIDKRARQKLRNALKKAHKEGLHE